MTMEPSTLMIMVWHSVCVCVSARRVEEPIWCVNVEISHSPLFSLLLESLRFSVFIIFSFVPLLPMLLWPVHLSLGLLALLKYQISTWLTRSLCRKTWWRRNFFHIFSIFLSLLLPFRRPGKAVRIFFVAALDSWTEPCVCVCVFVLKQHIA